MQNEKMDQKLPSLEARCEHCGGIGFFGIGARRRRCGLCDGAGHIPTEFGERVLALMRHNFKPLHDDLCTCD